MGSTNTTLGTTAVSLTGGVTGVSGTGQEQQFIVNGTYATGDTITIVFTDKNTAVQVSVGAGTITGLKPTFCFPFQNKMNFLAGTEWCFSELNQFTYFNNPTGTGNGFINLSDYFDAPTQAISMANYQGRLALFAADNIQVWEVDADPTLYNLTQVLENIGTVAAETPKSIGDLDVLFLHTTGIRSLRVRDSSLNAYVVDVGSPIDSLIQAAIVANSSTTVAAACSEVEPTLNTYFCYLGGTIYVLSYYPSIKVTAWATFTPTYFNSGVKTTFTPYTWVIHAGQLYCRATDGNIYVYGGSDNNTYDATVGSWATSFLDLDMPGQKKEFMTYGFALQGGWQLFISSDPRGPTPTNVVYDSTKLAGFSNPLLASSYDIGSVSYRTSGTHIQFSGKTVGSTACVFSSLWVNFNKGQKQ